MTGTQTQHGHTTSHAGSISPKQGGDTPFAEGRVASAIERRTAHLPSDLFLWSAGVSIAAILTLQMMGRKDDARFVGQWAPTILTIGVYNKLVKLFGSE